MSARTAPSPLQVQGLRFPACSLDIIRLNGTGKAAPERGGPTYFTPEKTRDPAHPADAPCNGIVAR